MQPGHPPLNIPPRRDNIDGDFQELMEFILPAFDHLVRPNPPYMGGEMPEKPLLHPEYAQSIYDVVAQIQEHHRRPELLSFPECGDLFYTHLDDYLTRIVAQWYHTIDNTTDQDGQDTRACGERILDQYMFAFKHFHEGLLTIHYLCGTFNSQFIVLRDVSTGGYQYNAQTGSPKPCTTGDMNRSLDTVLWNERQPS